MDTNRKVSGRDETGIEEEMQVELGDREGSELSRIKENLQAFNGRGIRDETGEDEKWTPTGRFSGRDETGIEEKMQRAGIEGTAPAYILRDD